MVIKLNGMVFGENGLSRMMRSARGLRNFTRSQRHKITAKGASMKLYLVMHANYRVNAYAVGDWLGSNMEDGCRVFIRRKDAQKHCGSQHRVVTFETADLGKDARKRDTWK